MTRRHTEFDYGLTELAGQFHQDWTSGNDSAADLVCRHVSSPDDSVAAGLARDCLVLLDAGSPDWAVQALWLASTSWSYLTSDISTVAGVDATGWLRFLTDTSL